MKYILQTDNETIEIPIIRSKRKTLGLEVKYDGTVNARVPMRAPREIIERFIREHEAWITRKRQEWSLAGNNQDDVAGEFGERKRRGANAVDPSKILPPVETKEGKAKIRQYIERQGDYLIPCLTVPAEEEQAIGIWGQRHLDYLKQYRKVTYTNLLTSGRLNAYLADINRQAQERFERLIEGMKQAQGITEQLKAENALEWTGCLNNIRACAREIVEKEIIFA